MMNCSDGKPCAFPCRKMDEGKLKISDLPPNCPLLPKPAEIEDKTILDEWRGKKLGARSIWGLADLAAGAFGAADKEETLAQFNTGGKLSKGAYRGMATYRENVQEWKKKPEESDPPDVPTDKIYRLFMAAQNAAGCADPLLDWFAGQKWFAGIPATIKLYLSADYALPPAEAFDEEKIYIYELEEMAGRKRKNTPAAAKKEPDK